VLDGPLQHYTTQEGIRRISKACGMLPPLRSSGFSPLQGMHPTCHHRSGLHYSGNVQALAADAVLSAVLRLMACLLCGSGPELGSAERRKLHVVHSLIQHLPAER
jgi:hypothetical protein